MPLNLHELASEWEDLYNESMDDDNELDSDDIERMEKLQELADELGYSDLIAASHDSIDLIEESDFEDHARDLAENVSNIDLSIWPATCIDWEKAAEELQSDYSTIEWDGGTYYVRQ